MYIDEENKVHLNEQEIAAYNKLKELANKKTIWRNELEACNVTLLADEISFKIDMILDAMDNDNRLACNNIESCLIWYLAHSADN